jgi:serine O-acetyltransferase
VGAGARIGSNAVVVKDVPPGASVVGVPGHVVSPQRERERQREEMARRIGFEAYGQTRDMPDPITNAIDSLLDHIHTVEERLDAMQKQAEEDDLKISSAFEHKKIATTDNS